jgi:CheY-like chemotaxis protein
MFGTLKEGLNYTDAGENIRQHKNRMGTFLESPGVCPRHFETFRPLSSVSREKILIVDDSEPIVEFLEGVFENTAIVETAMDGEQALRKTKDHHFDVIISDVNMWGISGIEFYKRAVENDPAIGERFLFLTGLPKPETIDFFLQNNLRYMTKPFTVEEIKKTVNEIIASA